MKIKNVFVPIFIFTYLGCQILKHKQNDAPVIFLLLKKEWKSTFINVLRPSIYPCITKYLLLYLKGKALQIQSDENSFLSTTSAVLKSDLKKNCIW